MSKRNSGGKSSRASTDQSTLLTLAQCTGSAERRARGGDSAPSVGAQLALRFPQNILVDLIEKWNVHFAEICRVDCFNASSYGGEAVRCGRGGGSSLRPFDATKAAVS